MSRTVLLICVAFLVATFAAVSAEEVKYLCTLTSDQAVPPVAAPVASSGSGSFIYNTDDKTLTYDVAYTVTEGATAAHIHGPAGPGDTANPISNGTLTVADITTPTGSLVGVMTLTSSEESSLEKGDLYVNIHTLANPDGEIRGQIVQLTDNFDSALDGDQEVPSSGSDNKGSAEIAYDSETGVVSVSIDHDVDSPTAAHIHGPAAKGENADPVFTFESAESPISQTFEFTPEQVAILREGLMYINVHTEANPDGEIRGQIEPGSGSGGGGSSGGLSTWEIALIAVACVGGIAVIVAAAIFVIRRRRQQKASYALVVGDDESAYSPPAISEPFIGSQA
eukprot:TRINITY_DN2311_c0_g1_i1.p1 TRINITY_DN2311_c0_g1~~TRINITY_DN2311_c0_g1_i1.p1  ORF type:complete len:356 (+),score=94.62 TRINITY_DN2311_c0_g1_i1:55-1068(+)